MTRHVAIKFEQLPNRALNNCCGNVLISSAYGLFFFFQRQSLDHKKIPNFDLFIEKLSGNRHNKLEFTTNCARNSSLLTKNKIHSNKKHIEL